MASWYERVFQELDETDLNQKPLLCRDTIFDFVTDCVNLLYPSRCHPKIELTQASRKQTLDKIYQALCQILTELGTANSEDCAKDFLQTLPSVKRKLDSDARYIAQQDPACQSVEEVIICYPGFLGLAHYRLANILYKASVPLLPRVISEYAHQLTGIDIHPGAELDHPIYIDHGTGIVIGETSQIGHHVRIFQGVTLGAHSVSGDMRGKKRHPTIEAHVVIYANATVLGGDTVIKEGTVIGGNSWITESNK